MSYNDHDDLQYLIARAQGLPAQSVNGTVNATGVNLVETGAFVLAVINVGTVASGGTATVKLQSSKNNNTADASDAADAYADITGATVSLTGSDANSIVYIKCQTRAEKYVRVVAITTDAVLLAVDLEAHPLRIGTVQT